MRIGGQLVLANVAALMTVMAGSVPAQEKDQPIATFHSDRTADDRVFRLLNPLGVAPPEMKDRVLFLRNRKLECWSLPKPELAWEADLPWVRLEAPRALDCRFQGRFLEAWDRRRSLFDLRTGRTLEPPLPDAHPEMLRDGRLLFWKSGDAGMQFRIWESAWEWDTVKSLATGWFAHDAKRIVFFDVSADSSKSRLMIREIGSETKPLALPLPLPGYPGIALVEDRAYVTLIHPQLPWAGEDHKIPDPPPPFAWAHLTIDLSDGRILEQEIIPYSEACRQPGPRTGGHRPVRVRTAVGITGLGRLVVEPGRVMLHHRKTVWERDFKNPQVVYQDDEVLAIRTDERVFWLRAATGDAIFDYALDPSFMQYYHRVGPLVDVVGFKAKDPTPGIYSVVCGARLVATPRTKDPAPGTYGIDGTFFESVVALDGERAALNLGAMTGFMPGEIGIFDVRTGRQLSAVKVGVPVSALVLRGKMLTTLSASGAKVFAP